MAINQRLDIRGQQVQTITPQLQQAIEMLQMSNLELSAFIEKELEQNPLLERADGEGAGDDIVLDNNLQALAENPLQSNPTQSDFGDPVDAPLPDLSGMEFDSGDDLSQATRDSLEMANAAQMDANSPLDINYDNVWQSEGGNDNLGVNLASWSNTGGGGFSEGSEEFSLENKLSVDLSLRDHLLQQIAVDLNDPGDRIIAAHLVDMVDDAGYFRGDLDNVVQQLQCTTERATFTLLRLQQLDPPGVFARSLSECLALQLREKNRLDPMMQKFLAHLDLLGAHKLTELQKICGCNLEDLREMIAEIKELNPKPGESFKREEAQTLIPDIYLRPQKGGGWMVELNTETLPRVLVNNRYYAQVKQNSQAKDDKKYLSEKFQSANWLVKAMHQRAQTIIKVSTEIVRQQEAFFNYGIEYLRPLVRREIAEVVGMHESTISRVTTNKFMATPRGIFELRYFFTASVAGADGGMSHSSESVRHRIKGLIESEPKGKPLSDDKIVTMLRAEGIDIARRTVAKYREQMHIPSSSDRKRIGSLS